jgi:membrane-bound lytic murein transglycosylase F
MLNKIANISLISSLLILTFLSCTPNEKKVENIKVTQVETRNTILKRILAERKLVATTDYNSTNYFVYRGEPMGYQYELLKSFADFLGVKLEIKIINDLESSFKCINDKECDMIALGLTVTKDRSKIVDFSSPLNQTRQMLVQRKPKNWRKMATMDEIESKLLRNTLDLAGKTIHIQKNTIFKTRLKTLSNEIGANINIVEHPNARVEELIDMVDKGEIEYTISDEYIALVNQKYYPDIDTKTPVSFPQNIAWAVRKGATSLLDTINYWLDDFKQTRTSAYLYNKYFRNSRSIYYARSEYHSISGGKISPYDKIIRKYSELIDWDWRLLASLIYQESRFYPDARSWAGAFGLMQLMPHTAQKYGVDSLSPPEEQIKAGVKFIKLLDKQFLNKIEDKEERTKFVLASYNAGIAHVYDARRLAEKYDKDPNLWNENVDFYLLNKSKPEYYQDSVVKYGYCRGSEPYNFVYDILERFHHYQNVIVN